MDTEGWEVPGVGAKHTEETDGNISGEPAITLVLLKDKEPSQETGGGWGLI